MKMCIEFDRFQPQEFLPLKSQTTRSFSKP